MPKLLEAGDADAVSPAYPEGRWDSVQSGLYQVCACTDMEDTHGTRFIYCVHYLRVLCGLHRWLCYCHVPQSNDSLPRYETTQVFGRSLLKSIFIVTRRQLLEKFRVEKDKLLPEKRTLILTHFPK